MKRIITGIVLTIGICTLSAQWQLINDFQQWEDGNIITEAADIGWHTASEIGPDEYWMLQDPFDIKNIGLFFLPGYFEYIRFANAWAVLELPDGGIAPGESGTIFMRYLRTGPDHSLYWGTSDRPLEFDPVTGEQVVPGSWSDFNAKFCLGEDFLMEGDSRWSPDPEVEILNNTWYKLYMVVHNTFTLLDGIWTSTATFSVYLKGPGDLEPVLVPFNTDPPEDTRYVLRAPLDDTGNPRNITWIMFASRNGRPASSSAGGPYIIDDIYNSKGINLSDPTDTGWVDIPIDPNGDVDTETFLGWLNVSKAPYIWSYSLNGWIYMEEPAADAPGAWGYFYQ